MKKKFTIASFDLYNQVFIIRIVVLVKFDPNLSIYLFCWA